MNFRDITLPVMRYKDFIFPHNPRVYAVEFKRELAVHKVPMGNYSVQDLGRTCRVLRGEGEFFGPKAYETFKALACLFYEGGAGTLYHPVWQTSQAYFAELSLRQEPRADYVAYRFVFYEGYFGQTGLTAQRRGAGAAGPAKTAAVYYTVRPGDTLWAIAKGNKLDLAALLRLNPAIANPSVIRAGERVRIR